MDLAPSGSKLFICIPRISKSLIFFNTLVLGDIRKEKDIIVIVIVGYIPLEK